LGYFCEEDLIHLDMQFMRQKKKRVGSFMENIKTQKISLG